MIKRFLHVGVLVDSLDESKTVYAALGMKEVERFESARPKASVLLMEDQRGTGVELFQVVDATDPDVAIVDGHLSYETDDIEADLSALLQQGFEQTSPLSEDQTLKFVHLKAANGNHIELCEYK